MRDHIFRSVELLIYVFDVDSDEEAGDFSQFAEVLEALEQHSPDARVYVLVHKMDLVREDSQDDVFAERKASIESLAGGRLRVHCFKTSIWDETLYRAWSRIVYSLVPNTALLESQLDEFCQSCFADEVVLFESTTFLVIAHATCTPHQDAHRFEKISNITKQFKLSCRKAQARFEGMLVQNQSLSVLFSILSKNTTIMIVTSDVIVHNTALIENLRHLRHIMNLK